MRIYSDCYQLISEIYRDVWEMGQEVHPHSMQNKDVKGDDSYKTKEIINYNYCLTSLKKENYLFLPDKRLKSYCLHELNDRTYEGYLNPGHSFKLREDVWRPFLDKLGKFDYTYNERLRTQLVPLILELRRNPDSRQIITSIWNSSIDIPNLGGIKRVPCSIYYQLLLRNNELHIIYNQRSCDVVTHFGADVWLSFKFRDYITSLLSDEGDIKPGNLYHNIGSLHCYQKDWDKLKRCIEETKNQ